MEGEALRRWLDKLKKEFVMRMAAISSVDSGSTEADVDVDADASTDSGFTAYLATANSRTAEAAELEEPASQLDAASRSLASTTPDEVGDDGNPNAEHCPQLVDSGSQ